MRFLESQTLAFTARLVPRLREWPMLGVDELKRRPDADADLLVLVVLTWEAISAAEKTRSWTPRLGQELEPDKW
jgi:hypothetical protein